MLDRFVASLQALERRVFSLERRFRELAASSAKYLFQLLDVSITYDGSEAVVDGDVLTYDAALEKWVNAAPSGAGQYASIRVDHAGSTTTMRWRYQSSGGLTIEPADSGGTRGALVTVAGVYQVNAWGWSDGSATRVEVWGDSIDVDTESCLTQFASDEGVTDAQASALFALPAGGVVAADVLHNGSSAGWTLTVHLVHLASVAEGVCGG